MDNNKINNIYKRTLKCIYKEENGTFDYLTEKDEESSFHESNIQSLMFLIYLSPELTYLPECFKKKKKLVIRYDQN